ncbi:MAG: hypothetical protein CMO42_12580 [Verrucomicrobiales bacterium]|nr:hypothetical protein [Verrucomicrobiales bacterium]|tara:strand:- start:668 stop:2101 length:1434 start_codon:yes stop_codon:yes gene_type:complete
MLELPADPTEEQLKTLQTYLKLQKQKQKSQYGKQDYYQERIEITKGLILFRHKQMKSDVWYMRFYVGDKKYKTLSLRTSDKEVARGRALDRWRQLTNHLEQGGEVFEKTTMESLDQYLVHLDELLESQQYKKHTINGKKTSLKKLRVFLEPYGKPSEIPAHVLTDYTKWRRTKNWDKSKHRNNHQPPTDQTINKELTDFKGFFDWCKSKRIYVQDIEYPFRKIDWSKSKQKNPSFEVDDWLSIVYYLRTWTRKTENRKVFGIFYRKVFAEFLKVLANSGLRNHECLLLRWSDIELRSKTEKSSKGDRERIIAHIQVSPDTKTGRRLVICPAGVYFKRIRDLYCAQEGKAPSKNDYVFRNIGTTHSREDHFVGRALTADHFRKLWYELLEDLRVDKGIEFENQYTIYSCRAFFINQRLELGIPPAVVADLVGHSMKTMEKFYKNVKLKNMESELVVMRKKKLEDGDFQTFDLEQMPLP